MTHQRTIAIGAALLTAAASPCTANETTTVTPVTSSTNDGGSIISFPLLSHNHVVHRRRRELRDAGETDIGNSSFDRIPNTHRTSTRLRKNDNNRNLAAQQQVGALYQGYGTHYIDIWVGYPAQRQTAVVDTGSSVTAFPCSDCTDCGHHTDTPFQESKSESFRATHCPLTKTDEGCIFGKCDSNGLCIIEHNFGTPGSADASGWTAYEAQDVAYAGGPHDRPVDGAAPATKEDEDDPSHAAEFSFPLTFGCQTTVSGYFEKQLASGVMGLDRRAQSFWGQMRASQVIHRAQFSLCFVKQPIASTSGSTAGAVTLGGVDKRLHKTPMVFAKSVGEGSTASFKVRLRKMYLREGNDVSVMFAPKSKYHNVDVSPEDLNGSEMYNFDSGTTDTYLIKSLSDEFRKIWKEITTFEYSNEPIKVNSDKDLLRFPTVILQLIPHDGGIGDEVKTGDPREVPGLAGNVDMTTPNDVMVAIPPKHYMQRNSKDGTYTSRIYLDRENDLGNVLGANAMMGHDILFDMDEARIGFSESDCDYARLVAESGSSSSSSGASAPISYGSSVAMGEGGEDDYKICASMKCRGFFGLTVAVLACSFFMFARRYVTKRDTDDGRERSSREYEMKSSSRNLHSGGGSVGSYSDTYRGSEPTIPSYSDEHLPGGERGNYREGVPPPSYSDRRSSRDLSQGGGRRDRSGSRESERRGSERRSSRDRHRSSSRDSADGSNQHSTRSLHSNRSQGSGGSGGSGGSRETRQSSRSHRSHRSSGSRESQRSHRSRESQRSGGSRERSVRSGSSRESGRSSRQQGDDRDRRGEYGRQSSGRSTRYRDEYDGDMPMPPSIS